MSVSGLTMIAEVWGDAKDMTDLEKLYDLLMDSARIAELTPITAPMILRWDTPQAQTKDEWGYTGMLIFAESHAAFHTWPEHRYMSLVISSCKFFRDEDIISYLTEHFHVEHCTCKVFFHGVPPKLRQAAGKPSKPVKIIGGRPEAWLERRG